MSLPAPLAGEEESRMIGRLGSRMDQEAKETLIEHNLRLVVYIAKKFDNTGVGVGGSDFYRNHWTDQGDQYF